jgi:CheY-like chemotaxis protein
LKELPVSFNLTTVADGAQLMNYLRQNSEHLPDILFLDLNMPCKNGFECLCDIKEDETLKDIRVVMFSTSFPQNRKFEDDLINSLFRMGAHHYIRKPVEFAQLKQVIHQALTMGDNKIPVI